jgi:plasmid stabilization system protein ParE
VSLSVVLGRLAERDVEEIFDWYEHEQVGLGDRFIEALLAQIEYISTFPDVYPVDVEDIRRAPMQIFPCALHYGVHFDQIQIFRIVHTRRGRDSWEIRDSETSWMPRPEMQIAS